MVKENCNLFWRVARENEWKSVPLTQTENEQHFFTEIPFHKTGIAVEYYIAVESVSGKKETQPRTAPKGFYQFKIK